MPESGSRAFFVVNLLMLQLLIFFCRKCRIYAFFFCHECRDYVLFGVEFYAEFWQKFSEIQKKLAGGASARRSIFFKIRLANVM